jgi:hypothetical protein
LFHAFKEVITVHSENHTTPINTFCGRNAELLNGKGCRKCIYRSAFNG